MNKRTVIASLYEIANELDNNGLVKEANEITSVMMKLSQGSGAPGETGRAYRTESNISTPSKADYGQLIKHVRGLMSKRDPASRIELDAIMRKIDNNQYGFDAKTTRVFKDQVERMKITPNADDQEKMYQIFKKLMPNGVTEQGLINNETEILDQANRMKVSLPHEFIEKTKLMLNPDRARYKTDATGNVRQLPYFGEHEPRPSSGYGFSKTK